MAGAYPDAPGHRMQLDADGTVGFHMKVSLSEFRLLSAGEMAILNNESDNNTGNLGPYDMNHGYLFPELRDLDGCFISTYAATYPDPPEQVHSSADTTNWYDGTWTQRISNLPDEGIVDARYRTEIAALTVTAAAGIRVGPWGSNYSNYLKAFHVYGTPSAGETPDRIVFLDTLNSDAEFTKVLDYAEIPRGQTQQRTIKIKNNSATKQINTIQITAEDLYLNAGDWYTFSDDDVTYLGSLLLGDLTAGSTKLIYVKQVVPDNEILGVQAGRLRVSHASVT